ncbi:hypothetical protein OG756_07555 [Streptomyces sp. NBC_01310]|uniref:hypothetical protein n=1 Tax=Streptomyces sp. NBC_01310 TaxID=2903820 RepID=UPI0035B5B43B|nr:hypothetical protein OG756_07555 [Streptomyces sp. NBC_01310]
MGIGVFLLAFGLICATGAGWVALDVRASATRLEHWAATNADLRMQARGSLGPAPMHMSRAVFRVFGTVISLGGCVLTLAGLAEVA